MCEPTLGPSEILHLRAVRMQRFAVLPNTPLNGLKVDLRAQVCIDPLVVICPATRKLNGHHVVPFGDMKLEVLVARRSRNRMPMDQMKPQSDVRNCMLDILDYVGHRGREVILVVVVGSKSLDRFSQGVAREQ